MNGRSLPKGARPLWSVKDLCEKLNIKYCTLDQRLNSHPEAPQPVLRVKRQARSSKRMYDVDAVLAWTNKHYPPKIAK